jgi:acetoin utilization protein AcuB
MSQDRQQPILTVAELMTSGPHCIGVDQTLELAAERMAELHVRHLPVLAGGELMGIISERDIALVRSVAPDQIGAMKVEEAMTAVPYCVPPEMPVAEVARHMALRKLGSAIVVQHDKILGVFTTTDALHVLADLLEDGLPKPRNQSRTESLSVPPH